MRLGQETGERLRRRESVMGTTDEEKSLPDTVSARHSDDDTGEEGNGGRLSGGWVKWVVGGAVAGWMIWN